jgi:hypothetical protein
VLFFWRLRRQKNNTPLFIEKLHTKHTGKHEDGERMGEVHYLTAEGAERLKNELAYLKGPARDQLAQRLRAAIQLGDLSENADYITAKEDQAFLEGRIQELSQIMSNYQIIE